MDVSLDLGALLGGAISGGLGFFGNERSNDATKQMAKLQEYYSLINAKIAHAYELENLDVQAAHSSCAQAAAYKYDRALAEQAQEFARANAKSDYKRSLNYIADSLAYYKSALYRNGYNPLLALQTAIPSYSGRTSPMSGGSVSPLSAGSASTSAHPSAAGTPTMHAWRPSEDLLSGFNAALSFAKTANDIKTQESDIERNKTEAVLNLERSKSEIEKRATEIEHRSPTTRKINAETTREYTGATRDLITGVTSGVTGYEMAKHGPKVAQVFKKAVKSGDPKKVIDLIPKVEQPIMKSGNSAYLGSRALQAIMPFLFGVSGVGAGQYFLEDAANKLERNPFARKYTSRHSVRHDSAIMGL